MKKSVIIFCIIIAVVFIGTIIYCVLPWVMLAIHSERTVAPPAPEITYSEFPIQVIYQINDRKQAVKDIIVCEFEGYDKKGERGFIRKWSKRLKSGNERLILCRVNENLAFYYPIGYPEYYMGDSDSEGLKWYENEARYNEENLVYYIKWNNGKIIENDCMMAIEAWEKYHFKIIDVNHKAPIKNIFPQE